MMPDTNDKTSELARLAAYSGDPWVASNPYFAHAENHIDMFWDKQIRPFTDGCDFSFVVDLACGHGRNSAKLLPLCTELIGLDIQSTNIEVCRRRFTADSKARFFTNNGFDITDVPSNWATLIYTFDAMVHFEPEVVGNYLLDMHRALRPGGRAFLHHSNYTDGRNWKTNPNSRNYMSLEMMRELAADAGLEIVRQKAIDWSTNKELDGLTLVEKPCRFSKL